MTRRLIYVASIFALIYLMDVHIPKALPLASNKVTEHVGTIFITGANSGVGYETTRTLAVSYGKNVILGCRSEAKCSAAAKTINDEVALVGSTGKAIPMRIDLSDFESVSSLVLQLDTKIDVLFNNAGYAPANNIPVNQYGLNPAFTSMHLSHHLLTELLLKSNNPKLRVINSSSMAHHVCAFPFAYFPKFLLDWLNLPFHAGCLDEKFYQEDLTSETKDATYFQAKIANMMHAMELPRRHPPGGVTAVAIDLGWVGTAIQPWMQISLSPTALGWMRNARTGILPVLHAIFTPDTELLTSLRGEKGRWADGGMAMNVFGRAEEGFSHHAWRNDNVGLGRTRMMKLSELLWDTSSSILRKNGYLTTPAVENI